MKKTIIRTIARIIMCLGFVGIIASVCDDISSMLIGVGISIGVIFLGYLIGYCAGEESAE